MMRVSKEDCNENFCRGWSAGGSCSHLYGDRRIVLNQRWEHCRIHAAALQRLLITLDCLNDLRGMTGLFIMPKTPQDLLSSRLCSGVAAVT